MKLTPAATARRERGFTVVELVVVMLIVGLLAAIAVPTYLHQRGAAHDASTKSDVARLGREVATLLSDSTSAVVLDFGSVPGSVMVSNGHESSTVNLTNGVAVPSSGAFANLDNPTTWCVSLSDPSGNEGQFRFSARDGLSAGACE